MTSSSTDEGSGSGCAFETFGGWSQTQIALNTVVHVDLTQYCKNFPKNCTDVPPNPAGPPGSPTGPAGKIRKYWWIILIIIILFILMMTFFIILLKHKSKK